MVVVQHPTDPLAALDATAGWRCRRQRQDQAIAEPLVIPLVMVVHDELADGAPQRALADQNHALEAGLLDGGRCCAVRKLTRNAPYPQTR